MIRCESCGFQNPAGALVCRRCRRRLRIRQEGSGPRRETETELTLVVAQGLTSLAGVISAILVLGALLALPFYHRVEPGLLGIAAATTLLALAGRRHVAGLRRQAFPR